MTVSLYQNWPVGIPDHLLTPCTWRKSDSHWFDMVCHIILAANIGRLIHHSSISPLFLHRALEPTWPHQAKLATSNHPNPASNQTQLSKHSSTGIRNTLFPCYLSMFHRPSHQQFPCSPGGCAPCPVGFSVRDLTDMTRITSTSLTSAVNPGVHHDSAHRQALHQAHSPEASMLKTLNHQVARQRAIYLHRSRGRWGSPLVPKCIASSTLHCDRRVCHTLAPSGIIQEKHRWASRQLLL